MKLPDGSPVFRQPYPGHAAALTLAAAQTGLLTAQQEVFANPAPVIPPVNRPVPQ